MMLFHPCRFIVFGVFFVPIFWGCAPKAEQPSVPDEKTVAIMADLCIADAATNGLGGFEKDSLAQVYFAQVFQLQGVTKEAHERNISIICQDVDRMDRILRNAEEFLKGKNGK